MLQITSRFTKFQSTICYWNNKSW